MGNTKGSSVINSPQGGGAQSGLGEKFSPDLFTGTGNFSVPIAVPPGRNGFQPELTLGYSSGNGNGIFGMGWAFGIPGVTRKTSKGIPVYDDKTDIFILSGAEDLVPVAAENSVLTGNIGYEKTTYRPRTEGLFARIIRHKKTTGEHYWEVRSKDGLISYYGTPGADPVNAPDPAIIANPEDRNSIYAWHLTKTEDPFGNVILYEYDRDLVTPDIANGPHIYDQIYLSKIKYCQYPYGVGQTAYLCEVRFNYEDRPDPFSAYKQGFETRTVKRCSSIETWTNPSTGSIKTKTYHFNYNTNLPLNGASMLGSVSVEGHNDTESEFMPPLEFGYSDFKPQNRQLTDIQGPIPVNSIAEPGFELVDITGNGLPDLLQLNGTARYWTNKGNGKFSTPKNLNIAPSVQLGKPGVQFIDANGDGRTDLLVNNGVTAGYFPGAFRQVWDSNGFKTYSQIPSFSFADPEVQLMDLDGDGITDVLRNGSKFECFYNDPVKGFNKVRTAIKTFADFSFADPRIRFADMTGDGLQDIVLISSGRVQYWPNLGYGRFGKKVNMTNAPVFPEQYDPKQILIGDLDGDGQADIAFVENNRVTLSINQSGNGFSDPVVIKNTPRIYHLNAIRICDIMGTGQSGILWSFGPDAGTPGKMFFLDFTAAKDTFSNKPYVLEQMNNNMGSLTRVKYGSSIYHYLRDEALPDTRWKTDLPFPVQVVNRVEVLDLLSGGKLVTEYKYHNGYWDGVEREFRGFAHVDSLDTEEFDSYNTANLFDSNTQFTPDNSATPQSVTTQTVASEHYSPPTLTKSWFYVGPVGDGFSRWKEPDFSTEYWVGDTPVFSRPDDMNNLLSSLPRRARRDALRTLRGTLLRSELYALDKSPLQDKPYTVTESMMSLRLESDPGPVPILWTEKNYYWSGGGYIFFPFNIAQRTTQYERGNDPMHNFSFTKLYDKYGQAQGQLSIGVPRGLVPVDGMVNHAGIFQGPPADYLATFSWSDFVQVDDAGGQYMVNRVKRSISWDLTQSSYHKSVFSLRDDIFSQCDSGPMAITFPVIGCTLNYYDGNEFAGLTYGNIGAYGAQVRSETLIITNNIISSAYAATPQCFSATTPKWISGYPTTFATLLQSGDDLLGYRYKNSSEYVTGWYAESARIKYDFQDGSLNTDEQLGRVLKSKDVFDNLSTIDYDVYLLMPVSNKQWLDGTNYLETTADYDYRVMQPYQVTDINDNISEFDFSPVGLLRATALIGKGTEGDYVTSSGDFYTKYSPSVIMEYDFFAFKNNGDPVWVKTTSREKHYQDNPTSDSIIKVEYSDGFGRLLQTRVQAEDVIFGPQAGSGPNKFGDSGLPSDQSAPNADAVGYERGGTDPLNVVVSGWKIYNNKGKVVEQNEPFFDQGFDYVLPDMLGVKVKMYYDALGRVVKTKNPNNSEQWAVYGVPNNLLLPSDPVSPFGGAGGGASPTPWINFTYDSNDLAQITNPTGSNVPSSHTYTPKSAELDALGRTIKTTEHIDKTNPSLIDNIEMNYLYDIRGNLLVVIDPYQREVFRHVYDLRPGSKDKPAPPIRTKHIDKGISTVLFDALGKPIESFDAKGAQTLSAYDVLQRPTNIWAHDNTGETTTLRQFLEYGDTSASAPTPVEDYNLKGKLFRNYDEAGLVEIPDYDFKGNVLEKQRKVIKDSEILSVFGGAIVNCYRVDWSILPSTAILDGFVYKTIIEYDALNRINQMTYPQDQDGFGNEKVLVPTYNRAGALEKVELDGAEYISHIAYNAKGQRILAAYGNLIMTRYAYDNLTFRLLRQRSESYSKTGWDYSGAGNVKQDTGYEYDLSGNIVASHERTTNCGVGGIGGATPNALDRDFDYDAIYRLLSATGRENSPTITPIWDDSYRSSNTTTTTGYTQAYTYDKLGNTQSLQHIGNTSFTRNFNYTSTSNELDSVDIGLTNYAFSYDACGNQLTETSSRKWEWDSQDRPRCFYVQSGGSITQYSHYLYDSAGKRVKKLTWKTGGIYESISYIDGIFEFRTDGTNNQNTLHILDKGSRMATRRIGFSFGDTTPATKFNIESLIGSSIVTLDNGGSDVNFEEYYPFGETSFGSYAKKRYKYCGKERDEESGLYYYGARYYSAWTCRFICVDPLAGKYSHLSGYNYSDNNPVNDFDIDGQQNNNSKPAPEPAVPTTGVTPASVAPSIINGTPTSQGQPGSMQSVTTPAPGGVLSTGIGTSSPLPMGPISDAAHMAANVYGGPNAVQLTGGWTHAYDMAGKLQEKGVVFADAKTGLKSFLYERLNPSGVKEYAYVTAGTDPKWNDAKEDINQALGLNSPQYKQSVINARIIAEQLGSSVTFIGHSLGGGLASANALATGGRAITFNAAGLHPNTIKANYLKNDVSAKAKIDAYIVKGEIVEYSQSLLGLTAAGDHHYLSASYLPEASSNFVKGYNLYQRGMNHTMSSVMEKLQQDGIK